MRFYYDRLSLSNRKKLENREFPLDELKFIHQAFVNRYRIKMKTFKKVTVMVFACVFLMTGLTAYHQLQLNQFDLNLILFVLVTSIGACILALIFAYYFGIRLIVNQFVKSVRIGYPEYEEEFGYHTFK